MCKLIKFIFLVILLYDLAHFYYMIWRIFIM